MTMQRVTLNNIAAVLGIMILATLLFSILDSILHNFIPTNAKVVTANHAITISDSSPFSIRSAWAVSLNKTVGSPSTIDNISVDVTSLQIIHGIAGQFIKVNGTITNNNPNDTTKSGIAYISIVDLINKAPIDLEDWSASKGLYIPVIKGGQSLPIEWNVRLVKAGSYTIDLLFNPDGNFNTPSVASPRITMEVLPKINLNPGNVLPVAFGVPAIVLVTLAYIGYRRGKKTGIYK